MTLSIIIVSYNVKYFLEQCLCSVREAIHNIEAEVIVIDNQSSDNSLHYLEKQFPSFVFIENEKNEGFAKANNKAVQRAKGSFILFLNPDTILAEDTLSQCIFFFQQHARAGALGVRMVDGCGIFLPESKRSFPTPLVSLYKLSGLSGMFPRSRLFGQYALGFLPEKAVYEVDVLAGAFMMVRKDVLNLTGGFDEQFFMYGEDIDLSYRIQAAGFSNFYLGDVTIIHFKGESTKKGSVNYVKVFYQAMILFVKKYYRGPSAWLLRQMLQAGIRTRAMLSAASLPFSKQKNTSAKATEEIVLWGSKEDTAAARQIVTRNVLPNISVTESYEVHAADNKKRNLLVFCLGSVSYKESIDQVQQRLFSSYKWFGKNSKSIVGSDNKNKSGDVMV